MGLIDPREIHRRDMRDLEYRRACRRGWLGNEFLIQVIRCRLWLRRLLVRPAK